MIDLIDPRVRFQVIDADQIKEKLEKIEDQKMNNRAQSPPFKQSIPNITLHYQLGKGGQAKVYKCSVSGIEESV